MATKQIGPKEIKKWMRAHVSEYVDECNEVNCTAMVEAFDRECLSGGDTLDSSHICWDIAVDIAREYEQEHSTR